MSGVYIGHLVRTDTGGSSQVIFDVRDDSSHADLVYQTSDSTWEAYNNWGGADYYPADSPNGRATKVSYNRPFATRGNNDGRDFFFSNEYPMIQFLESNGYDVTYISTADTDRSGSLLLNHKAFVSVGHDEYWSGPQRANVEAARDAGVNLAFFSGNEVYWRTRWEPSIDGSGNTYRTLVCYKETWDNAKTDPSSQWTGTWRDLRFAQASDNVKPENNLTGTMYESNTGGFAITVPAADGKMRIWRNTSVATLAAGATATLAPNTLGYEFDSDLDNGYRPAGEIQLSTSTDTVSQYMFDSGNTVGTGPVTSNMTLYRAPSGALVFAAGTVQWAWGLSADHDGDTAAPDVRMQQATVNLLADMGAQPSTLQSGLVDATMSTDVTGPTASVTSPSAATTAASGSVVTVTGTATDTGGGVVGGVEVSTDGGGTWHPAQGRGTWTYTWNVAGSGPHVLKARATDDSGNIGPVVTGPTVTIACPCAIFPSNVVPQNAADPDTASITVGMRFTSDTSGYVQGVRFYKGAGNTGAHIGALWASDGTLLAQAAFTSETSTGWQQVLFSAPVAIQPGATYVVGYYAPAGHYASTPSLWVSNGVFSPSFVGQSNDAAPLHAPSNSNGGNGVYAYGTGMQFPVQSGRGSNYWVDLVLDDHGPVDNTPPTVSTTVPNVGEQFVLPDRPLAIQYNEPIQPATVQWSVTVGGSPVSGTTSFDTTRNVASFTPTATLAAGTTYSVTVSGVKDFAGNLAAPVTWAFTTATPLGGCPCTVFNGSSTPATALTTDAHEVELGMRIVPSKTGYITALRFYKGAQNVGQHTATLWSSTGQQLATASFVYETASGWQQVDLATPVQVQAGQTYVVSYHTTTGFYAATAQGFASNVVSGQLTAPASGAAGNGVYNYGASAFPTSSYNATNYWADAVFVLTPDTTPPTVASSQPSSDATSVSINVVAHATMSEPVQPSTVSASLTSAGGQSVPVTVALDATGQLVAVTPSTTLTAATRYTMTLSGGQDLAGNTMAAASWSFTTSGACPCSLFESDYLPAVASHPDAHSVELGVTFRSDVDGWVGGIRFYKGSANTGTHTGSLWSATGQLLATGTFINESATGWQSMSFDAPVRITAGTSYVASYHAPVGGYSADGGLFSGTVDNAPLHGLSSNYDYDSGTAFPSNTSSAGYGVDVSFVTSSPGDTTPPKVLSTSPANGAANAVPSAYIRATLSEALQQGSGSISVTGPTGSVPGTSSADDPNAAVAWAPSSYLAYGTTYTATLTGVVDLAGNAMANYSWTFTTAGTAAGCPCSAWPDSAIPARVTVNDANEYELGVKVRFDAPTQVTGIRFYKGPSNTGTHTGSLWAPDGTLLAQASFVAESASGWQTVLFSSPVTVQAGVTYTASYHTTVGMYSADDNAFVASGVDHGPLHVLRAGVDGANGVYSPGQTAFPSTASSANYWVDVTYVGADLTPPVITAAGATGSGSTATITWTTDEASTSSVAYGTSTSLGSTAGATTLVNSHSVTLTGLVPNTRYYYRVTSADGSGNSAAYPATASPPLSYVPPVTPVTATTVADFSTGAQSNTYVSDTAGGEVALNATVHNEFTGATVPAGFATTLNGTGGTATVANSSITVDGALVGTSGTYTGARAVEFAATFGTAAGQQAGFGTTLATTTPWAVFSTRNGNELVASTRISGTLLTETVLSPLLLGSEHVFRVDTTGTQAIYTADGAVVATHTFVALTATRPVISDKTVGGGVLAVNWLRMSPYPTSGTFTSAVVDALAPVAWGAATWASTVPASGGSVVVQVRSGPTATPGTGWTAWTTVTNGGGLARTARYLQYQVTLTSASDHRSTPSFNNIALAFSVV